MILETASVPQGRLRTRTTPVRFGEGILLDGAIAIAQTLAHKIAAEKVQLSPSLAPASTRKQSPALGKGLLRVTQASQQADTR